MSLSKGFSGGFGGCLGIGCAVVFVLVALPISCIVIGGIGSTLHQNANRQPGAPSSSSATTPTSAAAPEGGLPVPAPATTYGRLTVTSDDFSQIANGMSYKDVVEIIGFQGEEMSRNKIDGVAGVMESVETVMFMWKNPDGSNMNAMFQNNKLMQKSQFGLSDGKKRKRDVPSRAERDEQASKERERADEERRKVQEAEREAAARRKDAIEKAKWRTWTSADGQHTIEAKFAKATGDNVFLEKKDGTTIKLQREKLSEDDMKWIMKKGWNKPAPE